MTSLGLILYKLTARKGQATSTLRPPRPKGKLIWVVGDDAQQSPTVQVLAQRLITGDAGVTVLLTELTGAALPDGAALSGCQIDTHPRDTAADVAAFLDHWSPQVAVFMGGTLPPVLIAELAARTIPLLLIEAGAPHLPRGNGLIYTGILRASARAFHSIFALNEDTARQYRKLGAANVLRAGRIDGGARALPHNEPERAALAGAFATRPIWLAVDVPTTEEAAVIAAHRAALRKSHRLMLILVPQNPDRIEELAREIEAAEGWIVARRDRDDDLDPETAVYIAEPGQEYGLWYRLAPITFLGGSLFGTGSARPPLEPASLGSAIIHGRKTGEYGQAFGQLGAALAAAPISTAAELAEALIDLMATDRAARIAHAAWSVATEGAEVSGRIVQIALQLAKE